MVLSAADRFGDAEAVVDGPLRLTFAELVERIRCAAGAFAELGVEKGDRVAIWAPNSAEWIIAAFGLLTAGGVLVPVNTRFKTEEAGDIIARSGAKAVLVQKGFLGPGLHRARRGAGHRPEVRLPVQRFAVRAARSAATTSPTSSSPRARPGGPRAR